MLKLPIVRGRLAWGANLVSVQDDSVDASTGFGVPSLSLSRYIAGGFSIGAQYSMNSLEIDKVDADYTCG